MCKLQVVLQRDLDQGYTERDDEIKHNKYEELLNKEDSQRTHLIEEAQADDR